ncbi:MAG: carboxylating nicotinate-nucleotide diphosphorylase [Deltaproteobacteria bacterium]|nr:carboxylating nicotinate-nucleotide diphosphorylase [Deltaproteobacteria bacterium]
MPTQPPFPAEPTWLPLVERALAEDLGPGDVTSEAVIPADAKDEAVIEARESLVVCGLPVAQAVFRQVDPRVCFLAERGEGEPAEPGQILATIEGPTRSILSAERTALNFLGRLCGIASLTARYLEAVAGTRARIVDTRKTLPGWRVLDKYAVAAGGGQNHRMGLFDAMLVKDNHVAAAGGVAEATRAARAGAAPHLHLQVEVESLEDAVAATEAGADSLLLDNRTPDEIREIVAELGERITLEASGGVNLDRVAAIAAAGVHRISVGALTHSAPVADVALEMRAATTGIRLGGVSA